MVKNIAVGCCVVGVIISGIFLYKKYTKEVVVQGKVIIFDGASSAGKSSVIKQLMPILDSSYHYIAIDDFVAEVFIEQQKLQLPEKEFLARVDKQTNVMYEKIRTLVADGKTVILDTVLSGLKGDESVKEQLDHLKNLPVIMVLVHCPLPVLVERIKQRNEKASRENKPQDERSIGTALSQFGYIYRPQVSDNEISLGLISRYDVDVACNVAKKECGDDFKKIEQFRMWLLSQFGLNEKQEVMLTTRLAYDFIVNTESTTPQECAQKIKKMLQDKGML